MKYPSCREGPQKGQGVPEGRGMGAEPGREGPSPPPPGREGSQASDKDFERPRPRPRARDGGGRVRRGAETVARSGHGGEAGRKG